MKIEHLKMLRNYFGEHSKTCHEHYLFAIVDEEIKRLAIAQQPLSGSPEGSPKCLNKNCTYYNEKFDMNCDANEDLCEKCLGTSDNGKRCTK